MRYFYVTKFLLIVTYLHVNREKKNTEMIKLQVRKNFIEASRKRNKKNNKSHKLITFQIGDLVNIRKYSKSDAKLKLTKKYELLYEGP